MSDREAFRKRSMTENLASGETAIDKTADEKTADEVIESERCAIPREIYNDISAIASTLKKTNCEVQIEILQN